MQMRELQEKLETERAAGKGPVSSLHLASVFLMRKDI